MSTVITVENLGKKYLLNHQRQQSYVALRDVVADTCKNFGKRFALPLARRSQSLGVDQRSHTSEEFWALKNVSFEVKQGDRVGIIGRNGAGKSTLLKILSRITEPTTGSVWIRGRVASLLEVGTGFHPELTGRENIFLNGAILGMTRVEIRKKFDEIVDFAEIEKFLDTPVKRYSSGMYVRLAFAVAAHLEPEILVVDEVLAVGDAQFQKKCLDKMEDVSKKENRTVLYVSHNMSSIISLTNYSMLIDAGEIAYTGPSQECVIRYLEKSTANSNFDLLRYDDRYIDDIKISFVTTTCESGSKLIFEIDMHPKSSFNFNIEGWIKDCLYCPVVFFSQGQVEKKVYSTGTSKSKIVTEVDLPYLAEGDYYLEFALSDPNIMTYAGTITPVAIRVVLCDPSKSGFSMNINDPHRGKIVVPSRTTMTSV